MPVGRAAKSRLQDAPRLEAPHGAGWVNVLVLAS